MATSSEAASYTTSRGATAFRTAYDTLSCHIAPPRIDILIQRLSGRTIPELGVSGHAFRNNLFALSCDPENPHFAKSLIDGTLPRQIIHEVHHCLRMAGPGYGRTLGEALVSEGLAGRFVRHLFHSQPEPWEIAIDPEQLRSLKIEETALTESKYDHANWFFGRGSLPRWLGYSLGYEMIGQWLDATPPGMIDWVNVPANIPIEIAIQRGLICPT